MRVIRGFPAENIVACFNEAPGGGNPKDINSLRNRPVANPYGWLSSIFWHSEFFQYEVAFNLQQVTINHPAVAGKVSYYGVRWNSGGIIGSPSSGGIVFALFGDAVPTTHTLVTHNLGYVPKVMVAYEGNMLPTGRLVQIEGDTGRRVSTFANESIVGLRDLGFSSASALNPVQCTYDVLIFRNPQPLAGWPLFGRDGNEVVIGRGKARTDRQYLRNVGAGDSPYDLNRGRTGDLNNGRACYATGGTVIVEPGYAGALAPPPFTPVGV
jgi:hypothetical protein